MKHIALASRLKHQERILTQAAAGTVVLLDLDGGNYYALDGTGGRAWELGNGQRTVAETVGLTKKHSVQTLKVLVALAYRDAENSFTIPRLGKIVLGESQSPHGSKSSNGQDNQDCCKTGGQVPRR